MTFLFKLPLVIWIIWSSCLTQRIDFIYAISLRLSDSGWRQGRCGSDFGLSEALRHRNFLVRSCMQFFVSCSSLVLLTSTVQTRKQVNFWTNNYDRSAKVKQKRQNEWDTDFNFTTESWQTLIDQSLDCVSRAPWADCKTCESVIVLAARLTLAICPEPRRTWLPEGRLCGKDTAGHHPSLSRSRTMTRTPRRAIWDCAGARRSRRSFTAATSWFRRPTSSTRRRRATTSTPSTSKRARRITSAKPARATCPSTPRSPSCSSAWPLLTGKRCHTRHTWSPTAERWGWRGSSSTKLHAVMSDDGWMCTFQVEFYVMDVRYRMRLM